MTHKLLSTAIETKNSARGKLFPRISETVTNGFFTVDRKWVVTCWNHAAEILLGVTSTDIIGKNLWEHFAAIIPIDFYRVYDQAFRNEVPVHFEEYWGEMGAWFDVITYQCNGELSVSFKSSNGGLQRVHSQNAIRQLSSLNELYRLVTEVTNDCLWEWDLQNKELFWIDGGHKRVFGYQVQNGLISQSFWESLIHPDDKYAVLNKLNKVLKKSPGHVWEVEYRFKMVSGSYAFVHDRGHIIYDENKKACRMIGATQDITAKKLLELKLIQERLTTQKEITEAVLTGQEQERSDIGKELHDNINQILSATRLYIEMGRTDNVVKNQFLNKASGFIGDVIEGIRKISKTMIPPAIQTMDLLESIAGLTDDIMAIHPISIDFVHKGIRKKELPQKLQLNIFRMVQEQLNNILKHSSATHVDVRLIRNGHEISLLVSDNGKGCDTNAKVKGVGIRNIISRAELYDGKVTILSKPGKGYQLNVTLFLNNE